MIPKNDLRDLTDLEKEYDDLLIASISDFSCDIFTRTRKILLESIEHLDLFSSSDKFELLYSIKKKAQKLHIKKTQNDYFLLESLFLAVECLYRQSQSILEELQQPYWDPLGVEIHLEILYRAILLIANQLKERFKNLSIDEIKLIVVGALIHPNLSPYPVLTEFFFRHKEFFVLKHISPNEFKERWQRTLNIVCSIPNEIADDDIFEPHIIALKEMSLLIDEKKEFGSSIYKLLSNPQIPVNHFIKIFSLLTQELRSPLMTEKRNQWKTLFLQSIELGELGQIQHCLSVIANPQYRALLKLDQLNSSEIGPYLELLIRCSSHEWLDKGIGEIVDFSLKRRLNKIVDSNEIKNPLVQQTIQVIEESNEYGIALYFMHLLELFLSGNKTGSELNLTLAIMQKDLEMIEECLKPNLRPNNCEDELGRKLGLNNETLEERENSKNEVSLIKLAARLTILEQEISQTFLEGIFDASKKEAAEEFFFSLHRLIQKKNSSLQLHFYKKVIEIIEMSAYESNDLFLGKKKRLLYGKWDDSAKHYDALIKIYLNEEEQQQWLKYCSEIKEEDDDWILRWRKKAYQGSQEAYGLWFHLCSKAAEEAVLEGKDWNTILSLLGRYRKMAALFIANIQVPRYNFLSYITLKEQEHLDKRWPGSPLNFGSPTFIWSESYTTLTILQRKYYDNKIADLIREFEEAFSKEIAEIKMKKSAFFHGQCFVFKDINFVAYPFYGKNNLAYVISFPTQIKSKNITGTFIFWNWPPSATYFPEKSTPIRLKSAYLGMWIHATGESKLEITEEIAALFLKLVSKKLETSEINSELARFIYLYSQTMFFFRGSASIGMILLNTILSLYGRSPPNAPASLRFIDCEAICSTESEFCKNFILWLEGGPFFS